MNRSVLGTVGLIAGREIRTRVRSKAFVITTVITALTLVALAIVVSVIQGQANTSKIGVAAGLEQRFAPVLQAVAQRTGKDLQITSVTDPAKGRAQVSEGNLDLFVASTTPTSVTVVVDSNLDAGMQAVLQAALQQDIVAAEVARLGGNPQAVAADLASAEVRVQALTPPPPYDPQRLFLGVIAGILIYLALMLAGQMVAQGVVEEKSSRVVELLLATVRPWQLMTGKVLGLGTLGLIQMTFIGAAGITAGVATGALDLPVAAAAGIVGWLLVWFLLGYLAYAFVFAALGALVSRQEDVGGVVTPVTMILIVGYVLGVSVLPVDPYNTVVSVLSLIPALSPTLMPIRLAIGGVPWWQTTLALVLMLATIPVLVALASRIYRNAVVRSGAKVRLRDALR